MTYDMESLHLKLAEAVMLFSVRGAGGPVAASSAEQPEAPRNG